MSRTWIPTLLFFIFFFLPINVFAGWQSAENAQATISSRTEQADALPTKKEIISQMDTFMELLIQKTDDNGRVLQFRNKADLQNQFSEVATKKAVKPFLDQLYREDMDGLYLNAMEMPPAFENNADYDMLKLTSNSIRVIQHNRSDFYNQYTIKIDFVHDGKWKIAAIRYE